MRVSTLVFAALALTLRLTAQSPADPDIEAKIVAIYPTNPATVTIFGQAVPVGTTASANLDVINGDPMNGPAVDPIAPRSLCPGFNAWRNGNETSISRIAMQSDSGSIRYGILVNAQASTGSWPGSAGVVQITDPRWVIESVQWKDGRNVPFAPNDVAPQQGFGATVNRLAGRVEWCVRGGCPSCGCPEAAVDFMIIVAPRNARGATLSVIPHGPTWPGNDDLTVDAVLQLGSDASTAGDYAVSVSIFNGATDASVLSFEVPFAGLTAGQTFAQFNLPLLDTSSYAPGSRFYMKYSLRRTDTHVVVDAGSQAFGRLSGPPALTCQ